MSPSEFEEFLDRVPFKPLWPILASGDRVVIRRRKDANVEGLSVILTKGEGRISESVALVSIPNIAMGEQHQSPLPPESRRRR